MRHVRFYNVPALTSQTTSPAVEETRLHAPRDDTDRDVEFDQVVREHERAVARLAYRLLGWRDRQAVEDVVQEVFLVALRRLRAFRGQSSIGTWLMGITINACRAHRRRTMLRLKWLRQARPAPDAAPADDETAARVRDAVAQLPPRDREVMVLFYLEELPVVQIADLLGVKRNAVEVRLHRARRRLKTQLADLIGD
jgi:RNA polymerase sigma factor (sigma-70 family)